MQKRFFKKSQTVHGTPLSPRYVFIYRYIFSKIGSLTFSKVYIFRCDRLIHVCDKPNEKWNNQYLRSTEVTVLMISMHRFCNIIHSFYDVKVLHKGCFSRILWRIQVKYHDRNLPLIRPILPHVL